MVKASDLIAAVVQLLLLCQNVTWALSPNECFVRTQGTHFMLNGKLIYVNGFNAYWMMQVATNEPDREKVTSVLRQASMHGMTVARTWGFSDGGNDSLQISPGVYNEKTFQALDFVISEAGKYGVRLIITLVNNWESYGGKKQYVQWAKEQGQNLTSEDEFFSSSVVKGFFKDHVQILLTRNNSINGIPYRDDPTVFAWELINEPRCQTDLSGRVLQEWIEEMAAHVKSIDDNHLLAVGLEGFYGETMPVKKKYNPGYQVGTDFISNNQVPEIDFASIHAYPDQWLPDSDEEAQNAFLQRWIMSHIQDAGSVLVKPLLLTEFGKSSHSRNFTVNKRDNYYTSIYNIIYTSARTGGSCAGSLFWQVMAEGMESWSDGYEIIPSKSSTTLNVISMQSRKLAALE